MKDFWRLFDIFGSPEWFVRDVDATERILTGQKHYKLTWRPEYEMQKKTRTVVLSYGGTIFALWFLIAIFAAISTPLSALSLASIGRWFVGGLVLIIASVGFMFWIQDRLTWAVEYDMQIEKARQDLISSYLFARNMLVCHRGDKLEPELACYINRLCHVEAVADFYRNVLREKDLEQGVEEI